MTERASQADAAEGSARRAPATAALVADVGGTNARFAWVAADGARPQRVRTLPAGDYESPLEAARDYLDGVRADMGADYRAPTGAALAVATAVTGDLVEFTNSRWRFSRAELQRGLGLERLLVLNDFAALALALPRLQPDQYRLWPNVPAPGRDAALAVLGPGTGLGIAATIPTPAGWTAVPGEGGHATLAPADDFESALLARVRRRHEHVSAERLLSGIGLPELHRAVAEELGVPAETLATPDIVARGLAGEDAACDRTLDVFCAMLGGLAGNVALTFDARGGLFVGGGIAPRLGERLFASPFRARFEAKGRFRAYLERIPTALVTDTLAALGGAAAALEPAPAPTDIA